MTCKYFQVEMAQAASGTFPAARLPALRAHCHHCPECALLFQEFQSVAAALSGAAHEVHALPLTSSPARFHPLGSPGRADTHTAVPRWLLATGAAAMFFLLVLYRLAQPVPVPSFSSRLSQPATLPRAASARPTLATYHHALGKAGDESFDALLARDADCLLRTTPGLPNPRAELF